MAAVHILYMYPFHWLHLQCSTGVKCWNRGVSKKEYTHFNILAFILGDTVWVNKTEEMYYSLLISFVLFPTPPSHVWMLVYRNWSIRQTNFFWKTPAMAWGWHMMSIKGYVDLTFTECITYQSSVKPWQSLLWPRHSWTWGIPQPTAQCHPPFASHHGIGYCWNAE